TLAGAVTISGIVALTLSPMMSAALMRGGDEDKGLAGIINRTFDRIRNAYHRALGTTFRMRGAIYAAWAVFAVLAVLMFMQSDKELAPAEDQGVIFGVVNTPSNSTLEQVEQSTKVINKDLLSMPDAEFTFQITQPTGGFWGAIFKPWDKRKRSIFSLLPEVGGRIAAVPGV